MNVLRLAARSLRREFGAGDLLTVFAALVLGVAVMTAVGTLVGRVSLALRSSTAEVMGGDLGLAGRTDIPGSFAAEAHRRGLRSLRMVSFPSVLFHGEASQMATVKAVGEGYPLRGRLLVAGGATATAHAAGTPPPGQAWVDPRLLDGLGLKVGDEMDFGAGTLKVAGLIRSEPDAADGFLQLSPPVIVNRADVDAQGLLGPGSRAAYRLMFAGDPAAVAAMREWLAPRSRGFRPVGLDNGQRGLQSTFDRAGRFLSLSALLAVLLAGVATALAANRFALRRIDAVAVLRCLGARQRDILAMLALELVLLAIPACALGVALGMAAQEGLVAVLGSLVPGQLPLPQAAPALAGAGIGLVLLLGFALPPLLRLRGVPPMRVLNRSYARLPPVSMLAYLAALAATLALAIQAAGDVLLALWVLGGLAVLAALAGGVGALLLALVRGVQHRLRGPWKLGLAALGRRRALSVVQLVGLALSLCALLLLAVVGPGLLGQWRARLPADTPNYFLLNIQPDQTDAVVAALHGLGVADADMEPFGTGRLLAINGQPPRRTDGGGDGEEDDADRPVNFSWRHTFPAANTLVAGRFWEAASHAPEASVEQGWAERYGVGLGDRIRLSLGDEQREFTVTSLRKAEWDSFRVNFFVLLNAGAVGDAPYNLISSFHLPPARVSGLAATLRQFPNVSLLDIDAILQRVREVVDRVGQAIGAVMTFSLLAGALVLLAALQATAGERRYDTAVLRTLGARSGQLRAAVLVEFGMLGGLAALLAVGAAAGIGALVSRRAFDLAAAPPWPGLLAGAAVGIALSMLAGWWGTRRILRVPPAVALREE